MRFAGSRGWRRTLDGYALGPSVEEEVKDPSLGHNVHCSHSQKAFLTVCTVGRWGRTQHSWTKDGRQIMQRHFIFGFSAIYPVN